MAHIDIFTLSIKAGASDVAANRFIGVDGTVGAGKTDAVTRFGGKAGEILEGITVGLAEVTAAEVLETGDQVTSDSDGKAVKADSSTYTVPDGGGDVVINHKLKYFTVFKGAGSGGLAQILMK